MNAATSAARYEFGPVKNPNIKNAA